MKTFKQITRFVAKVALIGTTVLFLMLLLLKQDEVTNLLAEALTYVLFEIILSKLGIGIMAFMLGGILVMAWGGKKQIQNETTISILKEELAEAREELNAYKNKEEAQAQQKELNSVNRARARNGKAIISVLESVQAQ